MDTDDLTDETYAIIADAHGISGLLSAELAISGAKVSTEREFLEAMSQHLAGVAQDADSWEKYDRLPSQAALRRLCRELRRRVTESLRRERAG
jgi:hypothetical protein